LRRSLRCHCSQARRGGGSGQAAGIASAGLTSAQASTVHHLGLSERARRCQGPEQLKPQYPVPVGTLADDCPIKDTTLNSAHLQAVIGPAKVNLYRALSPFQNEFRTSDSRQRGPPAWQHERGDTGERRPCAPRTAG
jgi:hypothetical protein